MGWDFCGCTIDARAIALAKQLALAACIAWLSACNTSNFRPTSLSALPSSWSQVLYSLHYMSIYETAWLTQVPKLGGARGGTGGVTYIELHNTWDLLAIAHAQPVELVEVDSAHFHERFQ